MDDIITGKFYDISNINKKYKIFNNVMSYHCRIIGYEEDIDKNKKNRSQKEITTNVSAWSILETISNEFEYINEIPHPYLKFIPTLSTISLYNVIKNNEYTSNRYIKKLIKKLKIKGFELQKIYTTQKNSLIITWNDSSLLKEYCSSDEDTDYNYSSDE